MAKDNVDVSSDLGSLLGELAKAKAEEQKKKQEKIEEINNDNSFASMMAELSQVAKVTKVKKTVKCQDCKDKELKLSINRFKCDACRCILCRDHYRQGLIYGGKYYNDYKDHYFETAI